MMILGDKRSKLISDLGLSNSLQKLTEGEYVHDELEFRCLKLRYSLEPEDFSPQGLGIVPLWESDITITGFYLDEDSKPVFINYYVEDIDDYRLIGTKVSELVDFLIDEYVEIESENEVRSLLL